jgi:hypothetical protein
MAKDSMTKSTNVQKATNAKPKANAKNTLTLTVAEKVGVSPERQIAELGLSPLTGSAATSVRFARGSFGDLSLTDSIDVMQKKISRVNAGDLSGVEATLTAQAAALDVIFNELARRAALNMGEHMSATETYLRMAFKAQAQCRATLETLAEVKYPKAATFVKQQNVAYQQQVNNGGDNATNTPAGAHAHGKKSNQLNELLEEQHGERLDTRTKSTAGGNDSHLDPVEVCNRPANG